MTPQASDWRTFSDLLAHAALPGPKETGRSFTVKNEKGFPGFGTIERTGPDQFVGSVVLAPSLRGRGLGVRLATRLVERARVDGADRL